MESGIAGFGLTARNGGTENNTEAADAGLGLGHSTEE